MDSKSFPQILWLSWKNGWGDFIDLIMLSIAISILSSPIYGIAFICEEYIQSKLASGLIMTFAIIAIYPLALNYSFGIIRNKKTVKSDNKKPN